MVYSVASQWQMSVVNLSTLHITVVSELYLSCLEVSNRKRPFDPGIFKTLISSIYHMLCWVVPDHLNRNYTKSATFLEEALCVKVLFTPVNNVTLIIIRIASAALKEIETQVDIFWSSICNPSHAESSAQCNKGVFIGSIVCPYH